MNSSLNQLRITSCEVNALVDAARQITNRDRKVIAFLYEHRVLTTVQIANLVFPNEDRARHRLLTLYRLGIVDRFRLLGTSGRVPYYYTLGPVGIEMAAAEFETSAAGLRRIRSRVIATAGSPQLAHTVGVNGFFASLATLHHKRPAVRLVDWWSERRCIEYWGSSVRPDGYGVVDVGGVTTQLFLEFDRGTESLERLAGKLRSYRTFQFGVVLFWFQNGTRERNFLRRCSGASVPFASANESLGSPTEAIWCFESGNRDGRLPIENVLLSCREGGKRRAVINEGGSA